MTVRVNKQRLERLIQTTPARANQLLRGAATEIVGDIVLSFGTSPDGETYMRGDVAHVASQPGYPPNVDTGTLKGSIRWDPDGPLRMIIHDGTDYGYFLEVGTERMRARPFITPVFEQWRQRKFREFARAFGVFL